MLISLAARMMFVSLDAVKDRYTPTSYSFVRCLGDQAGDSISRHVKAVSKKIYQPT